MLPSEKMMRLVDQVTVREVASLGGLPQISKQLHTPTFQTSANIYFRNNDVVKGFAP